MSRYETWKLPEIKAELKSRGARLSGRKTELIDRLEAYDRNHDFGGRSDDMEIEYHMDIPSLTNYKDVNSDTSIPQIAFAAINYYLEPFKKKVGSAARNLYTSQFLKYVRLHAFENMYYIRSSCKAEMKKHCTYMVDVCIDGDGCIIEGQCECAAGQGPTAHCKHVCAVLYALHMFSTTGEIITEQTCTQKLQTFHQCRTYTGSPIKAKDIPLSNKDLNLNFDPRPAKFRNCEGYHDHFRSTWLNHPSVNRYPVSQMFGPANTYAVNKDHDYLESLTSDTWLEKEKVTDISDSDVQDLESATRNQAQSNIWKYEHSHRITSSSFGKICLATERKDLDKLANALTQPMQQINSAPLRHGRKYESFAIRKFEQLSGRKTSKCGLYVSTERPYLAASPDAILDDDEVIEVKCPYAARERLITEVTVPYLKRNGDCLYLDESKDYYYQVQGQMYCTDRQRCKFLVYTFKDFKCISIARDDAFIRKMLTKLDDFFNKHFQSVVLDKGFFRSYYKYPFTF